jgi:hypothetical protein
MNIDADLVHDLLRRHEGTRLDFKGKQYDWAAGGNAELARDLMAMANALTPGANPAHILIGVDEDATTKTGILVGIPIAAHVDDAAMHQKVSHKLNRVPDFSYGPVDVDGFSIGVFQIRHSRRPIYPVVDEGKLKTNVPLSRDGSTTVVATPDIVRDWAIEDDGEAHELRALELVRARAAVEPRFALRASGSEYGPARRRQLLTIQNTGEVPLDLVNASCVWHVALSHAGSFGSWEPFETQVAIGNQSHLRPGANGAFETTVLAEDLQRHIQKFIYVDRPFPTNWQAAIAGTVTVECKTAEGRSHSEKVTFPFLGS